MKEADIQDASPADLTPEKILTQLELKYVVSEALNGNIKLT